MPNQLNLFMVQDTKTKKIVKKGFGPKQKQDAKEIRNRLNEESGSDNRFVVAKGEDHIHYCNH
tara:strand:- start:427 stop:615 length:189 start_codon:yes stop_codon:yes gene_type:complete